MPIAQDAGGYGGTWWSLKNVEEMWEAIANQDTTSHYKLLTGWRRSFELTFEHLTQVKNYRENLAEAWPPEKSPASAAYLARLDALITQLQETCDKAATNHDTFAVATLAISASRDSLKPLFDEYVSNKTKLANFAAASSQHPVGAGKYVIPAPTPPVPAGRQEELNSRARAIMYGLSNEIMTATAQIAKPTRYNSTASINNQGQKYEESQFAAPPIPQITPAVADRSVFPNANDNKNAPQDTAPQLGPTLHEGLPTSITPPPVSLEADPPLMASGRSSNATPPGPLQPLGFTNVIGARPETIGPPAPLRPFRPSTSRAPTASVRAMPPGGVIGAPPGLGIGQPAPAGRSVQRINPIGGIIQPAGSMAQPGTDRRNGTSSTPPLVGTSNRPPNRDDTATSMQNRDPDSPWHTARGVDPIILPDEERPIDPGPAIGLQ